jgi:hypothetical protein
VIPYHVERLEFGSELDGSEDFFQMFWPVVLSHKVQKLPILKQKKHPVLK